MTLWASLKCDFFFWVTMLNLENDFLCATEALASCLRTPRTVFQIFSTKFADEESWGTWGCIAFLLSSLLRVRVPMTIVSRRGTRQTQYYFSKLEWINISWDYKMTDFVCLGVSQVMSVLNKHRSWIRNYVTCVLLGTLNGETPNIGTGGVTLKSSWLLL